MRNQYSPQLIADITAYYRERRGIELSTEEAEQYLNSLADLYRCFQGSIRDEHPTKTTKLHSHP